MSLRILLIEKDMATVGLLVPGLQRKGYQVATAQTQRQAMNHIHALRPDLLVLDIASFGANGYKISTAVRAKLETVPTILLLEKGHANAGTTADAFMTPPFTSRKLLHRIKNVAAKLTSREIRSGPLTFDPDTRTLHKGENSSHLRPKEAALLTYLMQNPGRVLSRREIIKQVWETDYIGDTRTLSVHIRWLRVKIEEDPRHPRFLRTVRGVGYRFQVLDAEPSL